jgi:predicted metalloprotease
MILRMPNLVRRAAGPAGVLALLTLFVVAAPAAGARAHHPLCSAHHSARTITRCVRAALSDYWSGKLNTFISEPVHVDARRSSVPRSCRAGIDAAPAFTCKADLSLYINPPLVQTIDKFISRSHRNYAFAAVQGHEIGHVLQYTLHQPQIEKKHPTLHQQRYVEQQADCLDGVWARHEVNAGRLDRATFRHVAVKMIKLVSSFAEIRTHGTPHQRAQALDRGLDHGRPQACHLVTFG